MPRGVFVRKNITKERTSASLRESWAKRKKQAEKERRESSVKDNKFDGFDSRIENISKDELEDKLAGIRMDILSSVKKLGVEYKRLMNLQEERDKIEIRLEELGMRF